MGRAVLFREAGVKVEPDDAHASALVVAERRIAELKLSLELKTREVSRLAREIGKLEDDYNRVSTEPHDVWRDGEDLTALLDELDSVETLINKAEHAMTRNSRGLWASVADGNLSRWRWRRADILTRICALFEE